MFDFLYESMKMYFGFRLAVFAMVLTAATLLTLCGYGPGGSKRSPGSAAIAEPRAAGWNSTDDAVAEARRRYQARSAAKPIPPDPKSPDLTFAMQAMEVWAGNQSQQLLRPINWAVRRIRLTGDVQAPEAVRLVKVNTTTGRDVGPEFTVFIPVESQSPFRLAPDGWFRLQGMLEPTLLVAKDRAKAGPSQERTFIGPYCELVFWITPQQVTKLRQPAGPLR